MFSNIPATNSFMERGTVDFLIVLISFELFKAFVTFQSFYSWFKWTPIHWLMRQSSSCWNTRLISVKASMRTLKPCIKKQYLVLHHLFLVYDRGLLPHPCWLLLVHARLVACQDVQIYPLADFRQGATITLQHGGRPALQRNDSAGRNNAGTIAHKM